MIAIKDILGNFVQEQDNVVITSENRMYLGTVKKVCPKSVKVSYLKNGYPRFEIFPCGKFVKVEV